MKICLLIRDIIELIFGLEVEGDFKFKGKFEKIFFGVMEGLDWNVLELLLLLFVGNFFGWY